jgi:hypothetical protein
LTQCQVGNGRTAERYANVHYQVYPQDPLKQRAADNAQRRLERHPERPLNIILLGFDSTSRVNVYRYMPKTLAWMHNNFGWATDLNQIEVSHHCIVLDHFQDNELPNMVFEMKGKTIVGDGTTPQLTAMLTGYPTSHYYTGDGSGKVVDGWEFIFKDYVKEGLFCTLAYVIITGFITAFLEDQPSLGAFSLRLNGWRKQPTDHCIFK